MDHPAPLTVWLVEDDARYRSTVAEVLRHTPGLACTGAFGSVREALTGAGIPDDVPLLDIVTGVFGPVRHGYGDAGTPPDVLLLDVNLPGISGLDGLGALLVAMPHTRAVMLTVHDDAETIFGALGRGASGYVVKGSPPAVLGRAIREAAEGGMLLPPLVARRVEEHFREASPGAYNLTAREREVLQLMCEGLVQKEIADRLFVSPATVNTHVQHLYEKLHVSTNTGAVAKAFRERLIRGAGFGS